MRFTYCYITVCKCILFTINDYYYYYYYYLSAYPRMARAAPHRGLPSPFLSLHPAVSSWLRLVPHRVAVAAPYTKHTSFCRLRYTVLV